MDILNLWKQSTRNQFLASLDSLEQAISNCPPELWTECMWIDKELDSQFPSFWAICHHTLFWADLYLFGAVDGFNPPLPFGLEELDPAGVLPAQIFQKEDLITYLLFIRRKCVTILESSSTNELARICSFSWGSMSYMELCLDNIRHVQEHAAQLNMFLGQQKGLRNRWFS